ncbi:hypothetical protein HN51_065165 [Arachis hypogaea]
MVAPAAILFSLNLLFSATMAARGINRTNNTRECCRVLETAPNYATACLCRAVRTNGIGVPVSVSVLISILNACNITSTPANFQCLAK